MESADSAGHESQFARPKLRAVELVPVQYRGQPALWLRDPLRLSPRNVALPQAIAPLLGLMDGTRDEQALDAALRVRAGIRLAPGLLSRLLEDLDSALLLDNDRFALGKAEALCAFRAAEFRLPTLDAGSLPPDLSEAARTLQGFVDALPPDLAASDPMPLRGLVSPHIDYARGGAVYAQVWSQARLAAREAELVILLGTDHQGSDGSLTLTRQSYATPWGKLPTDTQLVDELAGSLGAEAAFAEELHHRTEHSIELAIAWLHFVRDGAPVPLLPILCGSFGAFVAGEGEPASHPPFAAAFSVLKVAAAARRTLVVAAADLAHMGPAFGDAYALDLGGRGRLRAADDVLLRAVCDGDADGFFQVLRAEQDRRHVCGLPPIYLAMRLLGRAEGERAGYELCPADAQGHSFVSIAGVVWR